MSETPPRMDAACGHVSAAVPAAMRDEESGWTQRVGAFTGLPALIRQLGGDPAELLLASGFAPDALDDPEGRIPYGSLGALFAAAARATNCAHFGLLAGRVWSLSSLGLVGELCRHSPTLEDALRALVETQHVNSGAGLAFAMRRGGVVDLGYAIYHGGAVGADQFYDAVLAAALNFLRELCGPGFAPSEVLFAHDPPADLRHYRSVFRVTPRFDCEFSAIRFPQYWLAHPIAGADPERYRAARARIARLASPSFLQQVHRATRTLLLEGGCGGDAVAARLGMHRRTLNRRLHAEGTTFQHVLDQVRYEAACQLLAGSRLSLDDVAASLGYAGVSPFMRTFRRWSGTTPGQWRRRVGLSESGRVEEAAPEWGVA